MVKGKSNPVAKFSKQFNKGGPMRDRKKDDKRGYEKHKKQYKEDDQQTDTTGHTNAAAKRPQNYVDPRTGKTKVRMVSVHRDVQNEKLDPSMGVKKYIDDFQKSDAPQFQGKSKEKRKEMAIAAYLGAKRGDKKESVEENITRRTVSYGQGPKKKLGQIQIKKPSGSGPRPGASKNLRKNMSAAEKEREAAKVKRALDREKKKDKPGMDKRSDDYNRKKYASGESGKYFSRLTNKEACWTGYRQAGMKKKGDKVVPNCVPESTDAYGKSQAAIRLKKQKAAMTPSDRDKMSKVADMMRKEREKKAAMKKEEAQVDEGAYKSKDAFGRGVIGRLRGGKAGAYLSKKAKERSDMNKKNDPGSAKKGYALSVTDKDKAMAKARKKGLSPKHPTTNYNRKLPEEAQKENYRASRAQSNAANKMYGRTSDPIDKKPASAAKKPISTHDLFKAIHKKYGSVKKENVDRAQLKLKHAQEKERLKAKHAREKEMAEALSPMDQVKLRNLKRRVKQGDKTAAKQLADFQKSKAKDIKVSKSTAAKVAPASTKGDTHIVMQLRKAQDVGGNMDLKVSPTGKKVRLSKGQIDSLLRRHDSMSKPRDKRMFRVQLTRKLRGMAK